MARKPDERSAALFLPKKLTLPALREAAKGCRGCDLYKNATQTVFGSGQTKAQILFIGEQPGDQEDKAGLPFVGPAGGLLDKALDEAGIPRDDTYVTNAVKHFKWEPRGKRRLHSKPNAREVKACRPWLEAEIAVVQPRIVVCLGATAAQSLLGPTFRVTQHRGEIMQNAVAGSDTPLLATLHPSAILRAPDDGARRLAFADLVRDLKVVAKYLAGHAA